MSKTDKAVSFIILMAAVAGLLVFVSGCATVPNESRNDRIIEAMDGLFDIYETMRIVQGKDSVAELIRTHPEDVAIWMTAAEALIQTAEAAGGDLSLLLSLQQEFEEKFLQPMKVPVV